MLLQFSSPKNRSILVQSLTNNVTKGFLGFFEKKSIFEKYSFSEKHSNN